MKTASQRFLTVVKEGINSILKTNGFKKKGQNFFKPIGEIGHIINIQKDKWNTKDEIKFTINVGIFSNKYWLSEFDFDKTRNLSPFPKESESIIREHIGELKSGEDYWYSIESQRIERKLIKDIEKDIDRYVIPFLNSIDSTENLINYLKVDQVKYGNDYKLFIMLAEEGLMDDAQITFDRIMEQCETKHTEQMEEKRLKYKLKKKASM